MRRSTLKTTAKQRESYYAMYPYPWLNGLLKELADAEQYIARLKKSARRKKRK